MSEATNGAPTDPAAGFPAIDVAGKEEPKPSKDASRESKSTFNDEPRLISQAHRWMRVLAFAVFGLICILFLCALLVVLKGFFSLDAPLIYLLAKKGVDWHVWVVFGISLVIFAAIPLTLAMALMRMISHAEKDDESKGIQFVTPQIEMLKVCLDALKQAKGSG